MYESSPPRPLQRTLKGRKIEQVCGRGHGASTTRNHAQSIFASPRQREVPPNGGGGIVTEPSNNPSGGYRRQLPLHRGAKKGTNFDMHPKR